MALLHKILDWTTKELPNWQQDAARRLLQKGDALTEDDYKELYVLMKAEHDIDKPAKLDALDAQPLAADHIPAEDGSDETVILKSLRDLKNVNRIAPNQVINFGETGITVIYGRNASGKSGYVRVMKRACRARDQSEPIHPDAYDVESINAIPTAKFDIATADGDEEVSWSRDTTPSEKLSKIAVFDSKCARSYVLDEKDVAYQPYGLDIVENLAKKVLRKISEMLDDEIRTIDVDKQPFQQLMDESAGQTEVSKLMHTLAADSNIQKIESLGTLNQDETEELDRLQKSLAEIDPTAKASGLRLSANRLENFASKIDNAYSQVGEQAVQKLQQIRTEKIAAENNEKDAANALQAGENLLPGTGDQIWKSLFDAARQYSVEVVYPHIAFPNLNNDAVCPLCQDPLSQDAKNRLARFNEYVKNDIAKKAKEKREKFESALTKLESADVRITTDPAIIEEIRNIDQKICQVLTNFENGLEKRKQSMLDFLASTSKAEIVDLPENPSSKIRQLAAKQLKDSKTFDSASNAQEKQVLESRCRDLSAKQKLSQVLGPVIALVERMQKKAALEKCLPDLQTRKISAKSKELASEEITDALKNALDDEFRALGVGSIQTELKERTERGRTFHQLLLVMPTKNNLDEILSEGEQRSIAIGAFLAELSLGNHSCGIVFDDPVSSLDHWYRVKVAKRLTNEATKRQVIIFTHDTSFLGQLREEIAQKPTMSSSIMFLESSGGYAGNVSAGLPWEHKGYKERIDWLEKAQQTLPDPWPLYPDENESEKIRRLYSKLRATLERVIQDVVFNGVIKRYRDWIKVGSLSAVVGFDDTEFNAINNLHTKCCGITDAHDPASEKSAPVPTADDLKDDIDALQKVIDKIKQRRNDAKNPN